MSCHGFFPTGHKEFGILLITDCTYQQHYHLGILLTPARLSLPSAKEKPVIWTFGYNFQV
jgi:hypothetical protein